MKNKYSKLYKGLLFACLLSAAGCKKLDVVPTDRYTDAVVWQNPANIELYIAGMYSEFQKYAFGAMPGLGYDNSSDALTDILKYTSNSEGNGSANRLAFDPNRVNASSPNINVWAASYSRIRRINEFLKGMELYAKLDNATRLRYEAEARFIRGYCYFWLTKVNGSIVLLDKLNSIEQKDNPRSSEDEAWNFTAADFAFAAEHLPTTWPGQAGRATKGAAFGMLARTWLYAASVAEYDRKQFNSDPLTGVPQGKAQQYYQNAANAAGEVIKLESDGIYALEGNYKDVFMKGNSKEGVFTLHYVRPTFAHQFDFNYVPPADVAGGGAIGVPTAELVDQYEMANGAKFDWNNQAMAANPYSGREPRFSASIIYNGAPWKGRVIKTAPENNQEGYIDFKNSSDPRKTVTGYYLRKMLDETNTAILTQRSVQPWHEMRYAEVLLIHAEALTKLNRLGDAKTSLDRVRARVGLPGVIATNQQQMMAAIEHERIVELAFEGHRYWDLRRWRKAHIILNNVRFEGHKPVATGNTYKYEVVDVDKQDRFFPATFYYMPIPQDEIVRNTAIKQILGW
jgi:hypothetical protein